MFLMVHWSGDIGSPRVMGLARASRSRMGDASLSTSFLVLPPERIHEGDVQRLLRRMMETFRTRARTIWCRSWLEQDPPAGYPQVPDSEIPWRSKDTVMFRSKYLKGRGNFEQSLWRGLAMLHSTAFPRMCSSYFC